MLKVAERAGGVATVALLTLLAPGPTIAANNLQADMDAVLRADARNNGIAVSVRDHGDRSILVYDLTSVAPTNSMADVFRVFLRFASAEKGRDFESIELRFRGRPKFLITGKYFKQLGEEFGTQNPVFTIRTFPENVMKLDGFRAYPSWTGGLIGVVNKQMEDSNDFHRQWWLSDFVAGAAASQADLKATPALLPDAAQIQSQPQPKTTAPPVPGSPEPAPNDQSTSHRISLSPAPSNVPMQLPAWLEIFPGSRNQVSSNKVGSADISYSAHASPDEVTSFYRAGLTRSGVAIQASFNGVGTTIQASLDTISCVIRITDEDPGTSVKVKCANGEVGSSAYAAAPPASPPLPPGVHRIEYSISGSARVVGLTYRNATGGTEQNEVRVPGSLSFYAATGQFVYISAQNKSDSGDVQVSITVDGRLLQHANSSAAYGIATASGSVPR